jgi:6-phosphogluconate dehydrogenase
MADQKCKIGIIGLGVMGRNFLLNIAEHGFPAAGYDKDSNKVLALRNEGKKLPVFGSKDLKEFLGMLEQPRSILLLVPAGAPVDAVINELLPHLQKGDLIIDAGNSYFKDTNYRMQNLNSKGILFLGVGISGGEEGARLGPSIMPGGAREAYEKVRPILEAVAAKANNDPCVAYLGPHSAGHYVKMVHNGIEYALMQLIAEAYDLMKRCLGMSNEAIGDIFTSWNGGKLSSYLIQITGSIFDKVDEKTGNPFIDEIVNVAEQNGTGMWTSQSANELLVPVPTIDVAVSMRNLSMLEKELKRASEVLHRPIQRLKGDQKAFLKQLENALYVGLISAYAQGLSLLSVASTKFGYDFELEAIVRIWRGGCIIRSALLEIIRKAYKSDPALSNLILDPKIAADIKKYDEDLRHIVKEGSESGIPLIGIMTVLGYLDAFRSAWLPANLIQAQRDYFGAHSVELYGSKGTIHINWESNQRS